MDDDYEPPLYELGLCSDCLVDLGVERRFNDDGTWVEPRRAVTINDGYAVCARHAVEHGKVHLNPRVTPAYLPRSGSSG